MLGEPANTSGVGVLHNAGMIKFSGDAGKMEGIILNSSTPFCSATRTSTSVASLPQCERFNNAQDDKKSE